MYIYLMYNTKYVCRYNSQDIFLDTDNISDDEKNFIIDTLYKEDLLNILGINEYNEEQINNAIHELYIRIKDHKTFTIFITKLAGHFMSTDEELGLMILFAYDYLYLSHICISELLETGNISDKNLWNLKSVVF